MPEAFKGVIDVDVRGSEPGWTPFEPPRAPEDAPNVLERHAEKPPRSQ